MPTLQDTILNFFESRYNDPLPAVGSDESEWPIQLKITSPNPSSYTALFSLGLSARVLECEGFPDGVRRFELCALIPKRFWVADGPPAKKYPVWAYSMIFKLCDLLKTETIKCPMTFVSFSSEQNIIPGKDFKGVSLSLHAQHRLPDGPAVNILEVIPLFEEELEFERQNGLSSFLELLENANVPLYVEPERSCALTA